MSGYVTVLWCRVGYVVFLSCDDAALVCFVVFGHDRVSAAIPHHTRAYESNNRAE